jgi:cytochrome P450 RapN
LLGVWRGREIKSDKEAEPTMSSEIIDYPIVEDTRLDVDERYKEIQKQGPIKVKLPFGEPCWLATRYDDVRTVYGDRRFSRALGLEKDSPGMWDGARSKIPTLLVNMDPPEHTRVRRLTSAAFSPSRSRQMEGWVQGLVDALLDDMAASGPPADFVAIVGANLPVQVLVRILGVAEGDASQFRSWVDTLSSTETDDQTRAEAHKLLRDYISSLIAERRARRTDDLLSAMVEARDQDDRLSEEELISLFLSLWGGGFHTTVNQLGTTMYTLLTHTQHWQELVEDRGLLPAALEELWRWIPSFKYGVPFVRWATEDLELSGGTLLRAGEPVLPEHSVANRDESVFPNGWELDFHRVDPKPHLSLAFGPHYCMGAHVGHLEIKLVVETLLRRFPKLALAVPAEDVPWSSATFMRSVEALPVTW